MIRVLVVDDHPLVRAGLLDMLGSSDEIDVVGDAADGQEAIEKVDRLAPDVVLMDLSMPVMDGIETTRALQLTHPEVAVIILTTSEDPTRINAALAAGASGYLLKDVELAVLIAGIRAVPTGGVPLSPRVVTHLLRPAPIATSELTPRERQILRLATAGEANKQIARTLNISEKTVKAHLGRIFQRLGVTDRTQAAVWAVKHLPDEA